MFTAGAFPVLVAQGETPRLSIRASARSQGEGR